MTSSSTGRGVVAHLLSRLPVIVVSALLSTAAVTVLVDETRDAGTIALAATTLPGFDTDELPGALPTVGALARATVRVDGAVDVVEWVRTARPVTTVTLSIPAGSPGTSLADGVVVMAADGPASGPDRLTTDATYRVAQPATVFRVQYRLSGVTETSPSSPARALVLPVALSVEVDATEGVVVSGPRLLTVDSGTVLALACSIPGDETALTPCGAPADAGWQVELEPARSADLVAAQVDLG